jgi:hypothetical protein
VNIYYIIYIKAGWVCWLLSHLPAVHATWTVPCKNCYMNIY